MKAKKQLTPKIQQLLGSVKIPRYARYKTLLAKAILAKYSVPSPPVDDASGKLKGKNTH